MVPRIRRARPDDLPALLPLAAGYCAADHHVFDEQRVRGALAPLLADDRFGLVLVAEQEALIGYAVVTWGYSIESGGVESLLDEIYVDDRGTGLGSLLIEASVEAAARHGARAMFLETEAHNARVRGLYSRHGFTVEDSVWMARRIP